MAGRGSARGRDGPHRQGKATGRPARWDDEVFKFEFPDWSTDHLFPGQASEAILPAESHSNQEDTTSIPGDSFGENKKRLRDDLRSTSRQSFELAVSNSGTPTLTPKRQSDGRTAAKQGSPRDRSSDSGGDSRELRTSRHRRNYADQLEKPDPATAAKNKASRERLRRERLNESFVELTKTLDPEKYVRAEKTTIIAETIKMINSLRFEVQQLRQDKDLLRGKIEHAEKQNDTLAFQQSLLKQELETAQAANYNQQQVAARGMQYSSGVPGPVVAMGVPMHDHGPKPDPGGLSMLIQSQGALPRQTSVHDGLALHDTRSSQLQQHSILPTAHSGLADNHHGVTDAFLIASPPDFLDLDLGLNRDLAALADVHPSTTSVSPMNWLE